ncbi:hypothetical protein C7M84_011807 [Penaeus vannamei]|uniref:Uncharacterized protein n=1 Tax=Penaeus vannamei TaxID=6689 RepID=A0A3R7M103_PENVA|nr:hypothetical protein C7M84_011807 [Penaeus vannamei]
MLNRGSTAAKKTASHISQKFRQLDVHLVSCVARTSTFKVSKSIYILNTSSNCHSSGAAYRDRGVITECDRKVITECTAPRLSSLAHRTHFLQCRIYFPSSDLVHSSSFHLHLHLFLPLLPPSLPLSPPPPPILPLYSTPSRSPPLPLFYLLLLHLLFLPHLPLLFHLPSLHLFFLPHLPLLFHLPFPPPLPPSLPPSILPPHLPLLFHLPSLPPSSPSSYSSSPPPSSSTCPSSPSSPPSLPPSILPPPPTPPLPPALPPPAALHCSTLGAATHTRLPDTKPDTKPDMLAGGRGRQTFIPPSLSLLPSFLFLVMRYPHLPLPSLPPPYSPFLPSLKPLLPRASFPSSPPPSPQRSPTPPVLLPPPVRRFLYAPQPRTVPAATCFRGRKHPRVGRNAQTKTR